MELSGKIIQVLPAREGVSQRTGNPWKIQEYILETEEQYPRKVCFEVFGADRIDEWNLKVGDLVILDIDIESREWNGRWFTSVRAYAKRETAVAEPVTQEQMDALVEDEETKSDLPF